MIVGIREAAAAPCTVDRRTRTVPWRARGETRIAIRAQWVQRLRWRGRLVALFRAIGPIYLFLVLIQSIANIRFC